MVVEERENVGPGALLGRHYILDWTRAGNETLERPRLKQNDHDRLYLHLGWPIVVYSSAFSSCSVVLQEDCYMGYA